MQIIQWFPKETQKNKNLCKTKIIIKIKYKNNYTKKV